MERRIRDVVEPKLLILTLCDHPDNDYELMTVVLTEPEKGWTEMLIRQRGGMSPEEYERARSGLSTFLDRMAQRLEYMTRPRADHDVSREVLVSVRSAALHGGSRAANYDVTSRRRA